MAKTDLELKQIAADIYEGKIFTDRHIKNQKDLTFVFMPLMLGGFKNVPENDIKKIGLIYEYLDKAAPRSINGMPCFTSLRFLLIDELDQVHDFLEQYKKMKDDFNNA